MAGKKKSRPSRGRQSGARSRQSKAAIKKTTRKPTPGQLMHANHRASGLAPADCKKLKREVAPADEMLKALGRSRYGLTTASAIPAACRIAIFGANGKPTGKVRYMFLEPYVDDDGKNRKYQQPRGSGCYAHFSPLLPGGWRKALKDKKRIIYFTEGEKKGDKACKHGLATIAFPGVNNFLVKETGELVPEIDELNLDGRTLAIVYDSDAKTNPRVMNARNDLARRLMRKGAVVDWVELPEGSDDD